MGAFVTESVLTLEHVSVSYRGRPALSDIGGTLQAGALCAVVGSNGAGKSTLLKAILGLLPLSAGRVMLHLPRQQIGYLPQQLEIDRDFPITVRDCALLGAWPAAGLLARVPDALQARVDAALAAVGMLDHAHQPIAALSAGQFQRVLFARLMVQDAQLILLDEPFNAMDAATTALLLSLVRAWHGEGRTVLAVLHDHGQVRAHFPETLLLGRELLGWGATCEVLP